MAISYPGHTPGLRNVGSYQVSGHPFVTGSADLGSLNAETKIEFPFITKSVTIIASGSGHFGTTSGFKIHFNSDDDPGEVIDTRHYISLNSAEDSITFDVKCKEIYLTSLSSAAAPAAYQLFASLTNIPTGSMYELTGAGLTWV